MSELVNQNLGKRGWLRNLFGRNKGMRLRHVIEEVYMKPLLITETGHASVRKVIESKLADEFVNNFKKVQEEDELTDFFGEPLSTPYNYDEEGSIRVIPVAGPIAFKASMIERSCGITDAKLIREWVMDAETDPRISTIAFDISSPGGTVTGVPELAEFIAKCKKKTISFTDDMAASAAYWIMSATDEAYATSTAEVGSIGVYSYLISMDKAFEMQGIKAELFKSGTLKGMGLPGVPLSEEQRKFLQSEVDNIGSLFRSFVRSHRGDVSDDVMQGQTVMGMEAEKANLIDAVVDTMDDIFA